MGRSSGGGGFSGGSRSSGGFSGENCEALRQSMYSGGQSYGRHHRHYTRPMQKMRPLDYIVTSLISLAFFGAVIAIIANNATVGTLLQGG